jgi:hypothetical protein
VEASSASLMVASEAGGVLAAAVGAPEEPATSSTCWLNSSMLMASILLLLITPLKELSKAILLADGAAVLGLLAGSLLRRHFGCGLLLSETLVEESRTDGKLIKIPRTGNLYRHRSKVKAS